ncbi:MAG: hypothetical protein EZS28_019131, partial [Streblomastix strix]
KCIPSLVQHGCVDLLLFVIRNVNKLKKFNHYAEQSKLQQQQSQTTLVQQQQTSASHTLQHSTSQQFNNLISPSGIAPEDVANMLMQNPDSDASITLLALQGLMKMSVNPCSRDSFLLEDGPQVITQLITIYATKNWTITRQAVLLLRSLCEYEPFSRAMLDQQINVSNLIYGISVHIRGSGSIVYASLIILNRLIMIQKEKESEKKDPSKLNIIGNREDQVKFKDDRIAKILRITELYYRSTSPAIATLARDVERAIFKQGGLAGK